MAHEGIFATSDEVLVKAGENYDTSVTEARINDLCAQSESYINAVCKYNFSDNYSSLNADIKRILSDWSSCLVAMAIISYNLGSYNSKAEAQTMLNYLSYRAEQCEKLLRDQDIINYVKRA